MNRSVNERRARWACAAVGCCACVLALAGAARAVSTCDWFGMSSYGACIPGTACIPAQYVAATCQPMPTGMVMSARIGPVGSDIVQSTVGTFFELSFDGDLTCGMQAGTSLNVHFNVNAAHSGGTLVLNGAMFMAKVDDGSGNFTYLNGHMFPNVEIAPGGSYANQFSTFQLPTGGPTGTWTMFISFSYNAPSGATLDLTANPILVTVVAPPPCPSDINHDGVTNTGDLTLLLVRFGQATPPGSPGAGADLNGDGFVNTADLTLLLVKFGQPC